MKARTEGILWSYADKIIGMISGLLLSSYLLRILGDTEYGIYQTVSSFANCLVMLEFGVGTVLTKNIVICRNRNASKEEIDRSISTMWTISLILAGLIAAVSVALYFSIDSVYANSMTTAQIAYAKQIYVVTLVYLLASFLFQTVTSVALGFENYVFSAKINLLRVALRTCLLLFLIYVTKAAIYIALIDACLSIGLLLCSLAFCKNKLQITFRFNYFDKAVFVSSIGLCLALFIQSIVNQVNTNLDKFLIGAVMGPEQVSLYSVGMYVFSVFSALTTVPITMYGPQIIGEVATYGFRDVLLVLIRKASTMITLIGGTIYFGFFAVGKPFIELVYGDGYTEAWAIALILMSSAFLNMITGVLINVLNAVNKRIFRSLIILATTILNAILTFLWLPNYGIISAAVATAICTALGQVIIMGIYYWKNFKINIMDMYCWAAKNVVIYQLLAMMAAWKVAVQISSSAVAMVIGIVIYAIVFSISYSVFSPDGRLLTKGILKRIKKKL